MNKIQNHLALAIVILILASCTSSQKKDTEEKEAETAVKIENCTYSYLKDSTVVGWTAFKFTEKTGVGGQFDNFNVSSTLKASSIKDILNDLVFSIETNSINTKNPDRDKKIVNSFFGTLNNTAQITGRVKSLEGESVGKCLISLKMNDKEQDATLLYTIDEDKLELTGKIDIASWDGLAAINALNAICKDLHIGEDGVSKLWSDVKLNVSAKFAKKCIE